MRLKFLRVFLLARRPRVWQSAVHIKFGVELSKTARGWLQVYRVLAANVGAGHLGPSLDMGHVGKDVVITVLNLGYRLLHGSYLEGFYGVASSKSRGDSATNAFCCVQKPTDLETSRLR